MIAFGQPLTFVGTAVDPEDVKGRTDRKPPDDGALGFGPEGLILQNGYPVLGLQLSDNHGRP